MSYTNIGMWNLEKYTDLYLQDRNRNTDVEKKHTDFKKRMEAGVG